MRKTPDNASPGHKEFLANIARSEIIQDELHANPEAIINPYDEEAWPLEDGDLLERLNIIKRAKSYTFIPPAAKNSKKTKMATVMPKAAPLKPKASGSTSSAHKKGTSRGAKKLDAMKQLDDIQTADPDDADGEQDNNNEKDNNEESGDEVRSITPHNDVSAHSYSNLLISCRSLRLSHPLNH